MITSKHIAIAVVAALAFGVSGDALAQRRSAKKRGEAWEKKREKIRRKIRSMRAWRLTEALDLDEKTAGKLFPIINDYDEKFGKLAKKARKTRRALRKELSSGSPNKARLDTLIDEMEQEHKDQYEWQRDRFKAVRKVLTPEQSAKIIVILPELDRQIRQEIRKAMRGAKGKNRRRKRNGAEIPDPF